MANWVWILSKSGGQESCIQVLTLSQTRFERTLSKSGCQLTRGLTLSHSPFQRRVCSANPTIQTVFELCFYKKFNLPSNLFDKNFLKNQNIKSKAISLQSFWFKYFPTQQREVQPSLMCEMNQIRKVAKNWKYYWLEMLIRKWNIDYPTFDQAQMIKLHFCCHTFIQAPIFIIMQCIIEVPYISHIYKMCTCFNMYDSALINGISSF